MAEFLVRRALISIVTLMLTAAFAKVQSDRRVAESSGANVTALALAKAVKLRSSMVIPSCFAT